MEKKKKNPIHTIIILICIGIAVYAAYNIISIYMTYKEADEEYETLREYTTTDSVTQSVSQAITEIVSGSEADSEEQADTGTGSLSVNFDELLAINPDIVGWLYIPAENISYPVVQGENNDEYLHTTVYGTYNFAGSIFMESDNSGDFTDPNTIIYGHNMKNQSMFGALDNLYARGTYADNEYFYIYTPSETYTYKMFNIGYTVTGSSVYTLFSGPSEEVTQYITEMSSLSSVSLYIPDYDENSRVVTLSTCASASGSERFVVQGLLVGIQER